MKIEHGVFVPKLREDRLQGLKLIIVLENACLELVHVGKGVHQLLQGKYHRRLLAKEGRTADESQNPVEVHKTLLKLLESPLNKAGFLLIYIRTQNGILIEVSPQLKCPETFKEFEGLIGTLLIRKSVKARDASVTLLRIIKNDLTQIFPPNTYTIRCDPNSQNKVDLFMFLSDVIKKQLNRSPPFLVKKNPLINDLWERLSDGHPIAFFCKFPFQNEIVTHKNELVLEEINMENSKSVESICENLTSAFAEALGLDMHSIPTIEPN